MRRDIWIGALLTLSIIFSGPAFSQYSWEWLNPLPSGLEGRDIHFTSEKTGFIVNSHQILQTRDEGLSWSVLRDISSGNDMDFYEETGYVVGDKGYVLHTVDGGKEWSILDIGKTADLNTVQMIDRDTVLITSAMEVFRSVDGGKNWLSFMIPNSEVVRSCFTSSQTGHAACKNGSILKTNDGGEHWYVTESVNQIPSDFFDIHFVSPELGFASREHSDLLKTTDGGESWVMVDESIEAAYSIYFVDEQVGYLAGDYGSIYKTIDGGETWDWSGDREKTTGGNLYSIYFVTDSLGFCTGYQGRILKTKDGGASWEEYASTYYDVQQIAMIDEATGYFLADKLYKTTNSGLSWDTISTWPFDESKYVFRYMSAHFFTAESFFVHATNGYTSLVLKTVDGGENFERIDSEDHFNDVSAFFFLNQSTGYLASYGGAYRNGIYKTNDGGANWANIYPSGPPMKQLHFIDEQRGFGLGQGDLYRTYDGGLSWEMIHEVYGDLNQINFVDQEVGFIAGDYGMVLKTADGGQTWTELKAEDDHLISIHFLNRNIGYAAGTYGTFFQTLNGGLSWEESYVGQEFYSLDIASGYLYAAGENGVILRNALQIAESDCHLNPAEDISDDQAKLSAIVASHARDLEGLSFEYGKDLSFAHAVAASPDKIEAHKADSVKVVLRGLEPDQEYFYRLRYTSNGNEILSDTLEFHTRSEMELEIHSVLDFGSDYGVFWGRVISREEAITNIVFEYGTDTICRNSITAVPAMVSPDSIRDVQCRVETLDPETLYFVRMKALYKGKTVLSDRVSFTTLSECGFSFSSPKFQDKQVTIGCGITPFKGDLTGIVFEYGTSREYEQLVVPSPSQVEGFGYEFLEVVLPDLDTNVVYFYRIRGNFGTDTIYSQENVLNFQKKPVLVPAEAEQRFGSSVRLKGLINCYGSQLSKLQFRFGTSEETPDSVTATPSYIYRYETHTVSAILDHLEPDVQYYFRVSAWHYDLKEYISEVASFQIVPTGLPGPANLATAVMIYPNPVSDYFLIRTLEEIEELTLFNMEGTPFRATFQGNQVDVRNLPPGIYVARIRVKDQVITRKIIKN